MRYKVVVTGEPMQDFINITSAIDYAARHVYLSWEKGQECYKALSEGKSYSYSYGFKEVEFIIDFIK